MRATWRAARFAVRRRRLQTFILGVVLMVSTATVVLALGLLVTVDKPFDRAFARVNGAHLTVVYDAAEAGAAEVGATAGSAGVTEAGGPYPIAQFTIPGDLEGHSGPGEAKPEQEDMRSPYPPGPFTAVERAPNPDAGVDRLSLTRGRWATGPGEIVMSSSLLAHFFGFDPLQTKITFTGGRSFTVVGVARSVTGTADGWLAPGTIARPDGHQMLYRLARPGAAPSTVTAGLPVVSAQDYVVRRNEVAEGAKVTIPFLVVFGALGLLVAVIIIANVVSGAVVSGFRHIGVLKAIGFTPAQVTGVYLIMVLLPGGIGALAGIGLGNALAGTVTGAMDDSLDLPASNGISVSVDVGAFLAVLAVVAVTALVPALRAGRVPAVLAISAGSASRRGRALAVQRFLAGTRLARPVSLGLGLPFARPGRTALTVGAVALGVAAVTFATGLERTLNAYFVDEGRLGTYQVEVFNGASEGADPAALRRRPGTAEVAVGLDESASLAGLAGPVRLKAYTEGTAPYGYRLTGGRWLAGPGEAVVSGGMLRDTGKRIGDTLTVRSEARGVTLTIVGVAITDGDATLITEPAAVRTLLPGAGAKFIEVGLADGTSAGSYVAALRADGLMAEPTDERGQETGLIVVLTLIGLLTLGVAVVAALGVFNTVVLNTRDRARDFGVLKSLGATPRQVLAMVLTSMAVLGLLGGLLGVPAGVIAHKYVVPAMADPAGITLPYGFGEIYPGVLLALFVAAGLVVALLGALVPAGWAAKIKTASALRSE